MNDNQMLLSVLAIGALVAIVIFRKTSPASVPLPAVLEVGDSQTVETANGPQYLTFNQPWAFSAPVSPISIMPQTSSGQIGQVVGQ